SGKVYRLKRNDGVAIYLRGIPREDQIEVVVGENGYISLPFLEPIYAADKTASELEHAIRDAYIDGKIYRSVTVNVMIPTQSYFIRGEVQRPSRYPLVPGTTILQALATAGGYSEFANARKIKVLRGDAFFFVDAKELEARPELDREVEAGDVIVVPRSVF
ncbi:MAG: polysaccharide biosynthesis/export family protein, partial [Kiritimatiellae bacterium]|nr:polysaccharide biosynthesis/export family protein [Kiritimatiellia bacterium]